jgi:hypothetical protein
LLIDINEESINSIQCATNGLRNLYDTYYKLEDYDTSEDIDSVIKALIKVISVECIIPEKEKKKKKKKKKKSTKICINAKKRKKKSLRAD